MSETTIDYDAFLARLKRAMLSEYVAVNASTNPLARHCADLSAAQLGYVLGQYSFFPLHIVEFLKEVHDRTSPTKAHWPEVHTALATNLAQELGSETEGKSHYRMLVQGVHEGLDIDLMNASCKEATQCFLKIVRAHTSLYDLWYTVGAVYAMESSAVPELKIVSGLVNELFRLKTGSDMSEGSTLKRFFDLHLNRWEPQHEHDLAEACRTYVAEPHNRSYHMRSFEDGFCGVMRTMDVWWEGLYREVQIHT